MIITDVATTVETGGSGLGVMPLGVGQYGIGDPPLIPPLGGAILRDVWTAASTGSRLIDQNTRDYVLDDDGRALGMNDTAQLVLMAVMTEFDSSAMRGLGQNLKSIAVIGVGFERKVTTTLQAALAHLTSRGLIALVSVAVVRLRTPGAVSIRLRWRDLATNKVHPLEI